MPRSLAAFALVVFAAPAPAGETVLVEGPLKITLDYTSKAGVRDACPATLHYLTDQRAVVTSDKTLGDMNLIAGRAKVLLANDLEGKEMVAHRFDSPKEGGLNTIWKRVADGDGKFRYVGKEHVPRGVAQVAAKPWTPTQLARFHAMYGEEMVLTIDGLAPFRRKAIELGIDPMPALAAQIERQRAAVDAAANPRLAALLADLPAYADRLTQRFDAIAAIEQANKEQILALELRQQQAAAQRNSAMAVAFMSMLIGAIPQSEHVGNYTTHSGERVELYRDRPLSVDMVHQGVGDFQEAMVAYEVQSAALRTRFAQVTAQYGRALQAEWAQIDALRAKQADAAVAAVRAAGLDRGHLAAVGSLAARYTATDLAVMSERLRRTAKADGDAGTPNPFAAARAVKLRLAQPGNPTTLVADTVKQSVAYEELTAQVPPGAAYQVFRDRFRCDAGATRVTAAAHEIGDSWRGKFSAQSIHGERLLAEGLANGVEVDPTGAYREQRGWALTMLTRYGEAYEQAHGVRQLRQHTPHYCVNACRLGIALSDEQFRLRQSTLSRKQEQRMEGIRMLVDAVRNGFNADALFRIDDFREYKADFLTEKKKAVGPKPAPAKPIRRR